MNETWYKVASYNSEVVEVPDVVKVTPKTITYEYTTWAGVKAQFKVDRQSRATSYFSTEAEAAQYVIKRELGEIERLKRKLHSSKQELDALIDRYPNEYLAVAPPLDADAPQQDELDVLDEKRGAESQ